MFSSHNWKQRADCVSSQGQNTALHTTHSHEWPSRLQRRNRNKTTHQTRPKQYLHACPSSLQCGPSSHMMSQIQSLHLPLSTTTVCLSPDSCQDFVLTFLVHHNAKFCFLVALHCYGVFILACDISHSSVLVFHLKKSSSLFFMNDFCLAYLVMGTFLLSLHFQQFLFHATPHAALHCRSAFITHLAKFLKFTLNRDTPTTDIRNSWVIGLQRFLSLLPRVLDVTQPATLSAPD